MAILTISRQFGSGAKTIGQGVADVMGYEYVDRGRIFDEMRAEGPKGERFAKEFDERYMTVWERNDWSYRAFVAVIQNITLGYATKGNVVLTGGGARFILRHVPYALGIRIVAPIEDRIKRVRGAGDIVSGEMARWLVEKADAEMERSMYSIYGKHWDNPKEYDMVFDRSRQTDSEIVSAVTKALQEKEKLHKPDARKALQLQALAAKIKYVIASDPTFSVGLLDVDPREPGMAEYGLAVHAVVHKPEDIERLKNTVKDLAGDNQVEYNVTYRMYTRLGPWQFK